MKDTIFFTYFPPFVHYIIRQENYVNLTYNIKGSDKLPYEKNAKIELEGGLEAAKL